MKRPILLVLSVLIVNIFSAQTIHEVEAGGGPGGPTPFYSPQFITIQVGDIVRWTNSGGTHNVDGRQSQFPSNPMSFFSGSPTTGWVFEFTFTEAGFYNYECGAFDHAEFQNGTITVQDMGVGIDELDASDIQLGPNPVHDILFISTEYAIASITVFDLKGAQLIHTVREDNDVQHSLDLTGLRQGVYIAEIRTASGVLRRLIQKD